MKTDKIRTHTSSLVERSLIRTSRQKFGYSAIYC